MASVMWHCGVREPIMFYIVNTVLRDGGNNGNEISRIAEISATSKHPIFTSVYHLINEDIIMV